MIRYNAYQVHDYKTEIIGNQKNAVKWEIEGICKRCTSATIMKRKDQNTQFIHCGQIDAEVPENVEQCSRFSKIGELSLMTMFDIAYFIDVKKRIGFESPEVVFTPPKREKDDE